MPLLSRLFSLWRNLFHKARTEQELAEEIDDYLEMLVERKIGEGFDAAEARRAALMELDGVEQVKERVREVSMGYYLETIWQDLRFGVRMLLKHKGFTVVVLLTLSLGIGVNTAIFSVVNATLLSPLPFNRPENLVIVSSTNTQRGIERGEVSLSDFLELQDRSSLFEETAAYGPYGFNITEGHEPEKVSSVVVSPNLFKALDVAATFGRTFLPEESTPGRDKVVVISYGLWQRRYGGDPDLLNRAVILDGKSYTVIGIMPATFHFPNEEVEIWAPLILTPDESSRRTRWLNVISRLKPKVTKSQARGEVTDVARQLEQLYPDTNKDWSFEVVSLHEMAVKDIRFALLLLFTAVGLVLLIACVNVANLMLSRVESRLKELAIRSALGAGRYRLVRQLLTESVLLSLIGGASGLLLALVGLRLFAGWIPVGTAPGPDDLSLLRLNQVPLDGWVFGFASALSLMTGVFFGFAPVYQVSRLNLNHSLKEGGKASGASSSSRLRNTLVVAEIALTLMLLIGAGLLIRSFARLMDEDPGFKSDNILTFRISPASKYRRPNERLTFYQQLIERIGGVAGVEAVGATTTLPISGTDLSTPFSIEGDSERESGERPRARFHSISPDYLRTMGIAVLCGRSFTERDNSQTPGVALINEAMARRYWEGGDPLGQRISAAFGGEKPLEIIGVVGNTRQSGLDTEVKPEIYIPYTQRPWAFMTFAVKTNGDPLNLANTVKGQVWAVDKDIPIYSIMTMEQRLSDSVAKRRFNILLGGVFASLSLVLAAVGIYGVLSYSVSQRRHEIGVRIALGAKRLDILKLIVGKAMLLTVTGLVLGLGGALALSRLLSTLLYGIGATDPLTLVAVSALLMTVALLASYMPAHRATKVDPLIALRYE